ncbi:hypothetical protein Psi01_77260 [Planobispora siamensis]|uniref:Uncharacterized protein n=1 Tax=Planobispora siamensis TaxID=936338 RepID=A0A8J3WRP8_9ACTN|nr:hypothetical protein Psi01_77260 [Planobispora siamensis]
MFQPGASLLSCRAAIPLSNHILARLAKLIRAHRAERRSPDTAPLENNRRIIAEIAVLCHLIL